MTHPAAVWPAGQQYIPALISAAYLATTAILAVFLSKRGTWKWSVLRSWPPVKVLVAVVMLDSLLFIYASGIIVLGVGSSLNEIACSVGIWWCILFYATSKVAIYLFLMERVYLVHSHTASGQTSRLKSPWYLTSLFLFFLWIGVAIVMIIGRISEIREHDGACIIGLRLYATVPLLTVDGIVNIFLTAAFVVPVYRSRWARAQRLARNSCIAAVAALATSFANMVVLTTQHGHQLSWVCLGACGLDVFFNSVIIFYTTSARTADGALTSDRANTQANRLTTASQMNAPGTRSTTVNQSGIVVSSEVVFAEDRDTSYLPSTREGRLSASYGGRRPSVMVLNLDKDLMEDDAEEEEESKKKEQSSADNVV